MTLPYGKQQLNQQDIDAVLNVLHSDFLTQGSQLPAFEQALTAYTANEFAVAVNSATSALHIACMALGVGAEDYVWTSPITFVASANCALYCGAKVDFVDVDPMTGRMCPEALAEKLAIASQQACLPKVIIPVHLCGHSCDMQRIATLARQYGVRIIEDASQALGASYANTKVGSGDYADISIFSFHPVKSITCAEGGVALTKDAELANKMRLLRNHGICREQAELEYFESEPWAYEQQFLGFNYRMNELQAALGLSQLQRLDKFIEKRCYLAQFYQSVLASLPVQMVNPCPKSDSSWHLLMIRVATAGMRRYLFDEMHRHGIKVQVHYIPVYRHPFYQNLGFTANYCPAAEAFYQQIITLPLFPEMSIEQAEQVVSVLEAVLT